MFDNVIKEKIIVRNEFRGTFYSSTECSSSAAVSIDFETGRCNESVKSYTSNKVIPVCEF
jgi:hypothetical protein